MSTPRFSIIIPVYNGEATIGRALDSVIAQTYGDWEVIVVNDNSTDNTARVVSGYMVENQQIKMVLRGGIKSSRPGGSARARNAGVEHASGSWIVWIDADDYVDRDLLSTLDIACRCGNPDILMYGYMRHRGQAAPKRVNGVISYADKADLFRQYVQSAFHGLPFMASRRELWSRHDIRFIDGANFCEDLNVTMKLLAVSEHAKCLDFTPYHYIDNPRSICNNLSGEHQRQRQDNILDMYEFVREHCGFYQQIKKALAPLVLSAKQPLARRRFRQYVETAPDMNRYITGDRCIPIHKKLYLLALVGTYPLWKKLRR